MTKINVISLSADSIFTCVEKLLLCHFQILNSLCQENKISIKKIFLMLIRDVSVPNTHYTVIYSGVLVLLWSKYPSFWSVAKDHSLTAHIRQEKSEWNWTLELNSHLTFLISLMSSGKLFHIYSGMGNTICSCAFNTGRWHLPYLNKRQSIPLEACSWSCYDDFSEEGQPVAQTHYKV